jgi:hypothetical protein
MLDSHPELSNPGELDFLLEAPRRADGSANLDRYVRNLRRNRIFRATGFAIDETLGHDDLVRSFVNQSMTSGKALTITVHRHFDRIPALFPDARYVHLVRDPRDVARSSIHMGWAGHVFFGVDHWVETERDFARLRRLVDPSQILEVRYEALVLDSKGELDRLCRFIGFSFDAAMFDYVSRSNYEMPDASLIEQWRSKLSQREVALVESRVGRLLNDAGYASSGVPPIRPNSIERFLLRQINRWKRNRFEIDRFGVAPFLAHKVSSVVPIPGLINYATNRYDAITARYLK